MSVLSGEVNLMADRMVGDFVSFKNEEFTTEIILTSNEAEQYLYTIY